MFILGLLNSKLFTWFACNKPLYTNLESMAHFKIVDLYQLPIKIASNKDQKIIQDISKQLLENQDEDTSKSLMKDIDNKVYEIYKISKDEIKFIENEYDDKFIKNF